MAAPPSPPLRIAVLVESVQLSDVVGIDLFGNLSRAYVETLVKMAPHLTELLAIAPEIEFHIVASELKPTPVTPLGLHLHPTVTYDDCPRDCDILLIGGPPPTSRPAAAGRFLREAWPKTKVVLTVCIGSWWLADEVSLAGKKVTTNRECLDAVRGLHSEVDWLDQRWVVEEKPFDGEGKGELWTAGGAGAGLDMIATFLGKNFDPKLVKNAALNPLEFNIQSKNPQFYSSSRSAALGN